MCRGRGNVLSETVTALGGATVSAMTYTYDQDGNQLTSRDQLGTTTTNTYDGDQLVKTVVTDAGTNVISSVSYTYDKDGNQVSSTDALGNVARNTYDGDRLMQTVVADPAGHVASSVSYTYDKDGNIVTTTDGDGNVTTNTYDGNRVVKTVVTDASGAIRPEMRSERGKGPPMPSNCARQNSWALRAAGGIHRIESIPCLGGTAHVRDRLECADRALPVAVPAVFAARRRRPAAAVPGGGRRCRVRGIAATPLRSRLGRVPAHPGRRSRLRGCIPGHVSRTGARPAPSGGAVVAGPVVAHRCRPRGAEHRRAGAERAAQSRYRSVPWPAMLPIR